MKKTILILVFCLGTVGMAQDNWKWLFEEYKQLNYPEVVHLYEKQAKKIKDDKVLPADVYEAVGESYLKTGNYRQASVMYGKLHQLQKHNMNEAHFINYTQALRTSGFYKDANDLVEERLKAQKNTSALKLFNLHKKQIDSMAQVQPLYKVSNISSNSSNSDFGTAFYGNKVLYASSKDAPKASKKTEVNLQPYLTIYEAERNASNGNLSNEKKFHPEVQNKYHNATPTFSPDYKTMYFSTNLQHKNKLVLDTNKVNNIQILRVPIVDGKLGEPTDMFFSNPDYSFGHPAMSSDGNYLYFTSDMPNGAGQTDIYRVRVFGDASYGPIESLGTTINTAGREMFPFVQDDKLYFASDGHYGYGGLDIFEATIYHDGTLSNPVNLGKPVNSAWDDFAYIADANDDFGYFSSNRSGGKGDDDIYFFLKEKRVSCTHAVSGFVFYEKDKSPIAGAKVILTNDKGEKLAEVLTNADGKYESDISCNSKVSGVATKAGYSTAKNQFITTNEPVVANNYLLAKLDDFLVTDGDFKKIDINTIYFDYNKFAITPQAKLELNKVVGVMQQFPDVKIRIESHTDSRGNDAYNLKLSDNRAKATQNYLIEQGIADSRIVSAKGYGESQLKNKCSNQVTCSEADHAVNRRSDFIIEK
ncbi:OmpA family protein [Flavobacterium agricola]|uniref:OmpA family protein n=1 Tax=Flavobacterium agricola TaxID=2870839 RepID=A0ABY6M2M9_9FLAO|nr:OmpA family protein [Flavobacterium agricola]UYW02010.1 OmpA family protein [Flavobacterium agricola]